jgi:DNA invertase Pin-like site-specific DNA recombinase
MTGLITTPTKRGWGYVRVSSAEQFEHVSSIVAQCSYIMSVADRKGIDLGPSKTMPMTAVDGSCVEVESRERIIFEAVSAFKVPFLTRPLALQLYDHLQHGDQLLFAKMDRAFADTSDTLNTTKRLIGKGVDVYFLDMTDECYRDSAMFEFQLTLAAALARMERKRKGERHREAFEQRRRQGRRILWVPCFQSVKLNGERVHKYIPEEREIQKRAYGWYQQGFSVVEIHKHLYDCGVILHSIHLTAKQAKRWGLSIRKHQLRRMLAFEFLIRHMAGNGSVDDPEVIERARLEVLQNRKGHEVGNFADFKPGTRRQAHRARGHRRLA